MKAEGMSEREMFKTFDTDASGSVDQGEFATSCAELGLRDINHTEVGMLFEVLDADGNGVLDADEIIAFIKVLSASKHTLEPDGLYDMLLTDSCFASSKNAHSSPVCQKNHASTRCGSIRRSNAISCSERMSATGTVAVH